MQEGAISAVARQRGSSLFVGQVVPEGKGGNVGCLLGSSFATVRLFFHGGMEGE